jgi:hypothetical protein
MFNEALITKLKQLVEMSIDEAVRIDVYLAFQDALSKALPCSYEELVDVAYDHEDPAIVIQALELIALDRDPKCKVILNDIRSAHPDGEVKSIATRLLSNVISLEIAKEFNTSKSEIKH